MITINIKKQIYSTLDPLTNYETTKETIINTTIINYDANASSSISPLATLSLIIVCQCQCYKWSVEQFLLKDLENMYNTKIISMTMTMLQILLHKWKWYKY